MLEDEYTVLQHLATFLLTRRKHACHSQYVWVVRRPHLVHTMLNIDGYLTAYAPCAIWAQPSPLLGSYSIYQTRKKLDLWILDSRSGNYSN